MNKYLFLIVLVLLGCTNPNSVLKPALTLEEFDREAVAIKGVITKFVQDNDPATVHNVSLALESTFAINCIPIGPECNEYHNIVTQIIHATQDQKFTVEEKMQVLLEYYKLEKMLQESRVKLIYDWKKYAP